MSPTGRQRRVILGLCLALALGATSWTYWRQRVDAMAAPAQALPARREIRPPIVVQQGEAVALAVAATPGPPAEVDPFAVRSWQPAPPPPPPAPPPPPMPEPTAPPLPFQYMGRQEPAEGAAPAVFYLTRGTEVYTVALGEVVASEYRFDGFDQGVLRFTYLPLSTKQELNIGLHP